MTASDACDRCNGRGVIWDGAVEHPCRKCDGTGRRLLRRLGFPPVDGEYGEPSYLSEDLLLRGYGVKG